MKKDRIFHERIYDSKNHGIAICKRILTQNYPLHSHDFYEFEYVYSGSGYATINGIIYRLKEGSLIFNTTMDVTFIDVEEPLQILNVNFLSDWIPDELKKCGLSSYVLKDVSRYLPDRLWEEYSSEDTALSLLSMKCIIAELLISVVRESAVKYNEDRENLLTVPQKVAVYIRSHYREQLSIKMLTDIFGYSPNYLNNIFRQTFNISIIKYLNDTRMTQAVNLLKGTDLPINNIAFEVGFTSLSNFMQLFKKKYNMSPSKFRKEQK